MKKKLKAKKDGSAEEKIKEAARKLFTQQGYAAVRTRDIAREAGINLALLNYYFRSKEKLFDLIMMENLRQFMHGISLIFSDTATTMEEKIEKLVGSYIDLLIQYPDLPLFVLSELRHEPEKFAMKMESEINPAKSYFIKQVREAMKSGEIASVHPVHFIANMIGLTVFPFVASPLLRRVGKIDREQFNALMQERKKMIPLWLKVMMKVK